MKVIYKYKLPLYDSVQTIKMPHNANIIFIDNQDGVPTIWAEQLYSEDKNNLETRRFRIFGTGQQIPDNYIYRGTVQIKPYVWHIYEVISNDANNNRST